jgi:predicted DNA-binding transcriptional regulator AlpA
MTRKIALPPTLAPRLVGLAAVAAYLDLSPNTFSWMVADGRMPRPKLLGDRRKAWDLREIDRAVEELPIDAASGKTDDTWGDVDSAT